MVITIYSKATGQILRVCSVPESMAQDQINSATEAYLVGEHADDKFYVSANGVVALPPRPSLNHQIDWATKQWVDPRTVDDLKAAKNNEINAARLRANRGTFPYAGKTIACDELSRSDIDGVNGEVALTGALPPGFPGAWKAVDNTYVAIPDLNGWKAFYGAMVAQGQANFAHAQSLKAQLSLATTAAEVDAIAW